LWEGKKRLKNRPGSPLIVIEWPNGVRFVEGKVQESSTDHHSFMLSGYLISVNGTLSETSHPDCKSMPFGYPLCMRLAWISTLLINACGRATGLNWMLRFRGNVMPGQPHAVGSYIVTIITNFDPGAETKGLIHLIGIQKSISGFLKQSDILLEEFVYGVGGGIWMWA
jgi:hypothetical protein